MGVKKFFKDMEIKKEIIEVIDIVVHMVVAIVVGVLIVKYVAQVTVVSGNSMEKYLHNGNRIVMEKFIFKRTGIKRGEIVIINKPQDLEDERTPIIKRVVGIAGDHVEIKDGSVYVNGEKIDEPYVNGTETRVVKEKYKDIVVPEEYIYVLGDNRMPGESLDSRSFGPISIKKVEGRAVLRFFPLKQFGRMKVE